MIVLKELEMLKKEVQGNHESFFSFLEAAKNTSFKEKESVLHHFQTILIKEKNDLIHLKYDKKYMHKNPWDSFYKCVRGLVINWKTNELVLYPFDKFYELNEHKSTKEKKVVERLNTAKSIVYTEKVDGSLLPVRYYNGEILAVSSGSFDSFHVQEAKRIIQQNERLETFIKAYPNHTIIFEMKLKTHPQAIKYEEDELVLIGMRDMETLNVLSYDEMLQCATSFLVPIVPSFKKEFYEVLKEINDPSYELEGYIVDIDGFKVKLKAKNFILAARYASDANRNMNMMFEAFTEKRLSAISKLINPKYLESFLLCRETIHSYFEKKKEMIEKIFHSFDANLSKEELAKEVKEHYPTLVNDLISMKLGHFQLVTKKDIDYLKKFQHYFILINDKKYAKQMELTIEEVHRKIETKEIQILRKYDTQNGPVYMIPMWQFQKEKITYQY